MAGTGKTTIAYSFCEQLHDDGILGASFICSRSRSDCNDVGRIFPTIAYELARSREAIAVALLEVLKRDPSASLTRQFTQLILEPVRMAMERIDRIVLDEYQNIRNRKTSMFRSLRFECHSLFSNLLGCSRAVTELKSTYRWCLTG